jgi:hypothetical protein
MSTINYRMIAEEMNLVLSSLYNQYLAEGRPTKKGGLRFLDVVSGKTFAFERCLPAENGNYLIISAPYTGEKKMIQNIIKKGPHAKEIRDIAVRAGVDPGKEHKTFLEIKYFIPTATLLSEERIVKYSKDHNIFNTREITRQLLRDYIEPFAKDCMDYLITIIRQSEGSEAAARAAK